MNSIFTSNLNNYQRYRRLQRRRVRIYYKMLAKVTLLIAIIPLIILTIMFIYGKLSWSESLLWMLCAFIGSMFFARPYLNDLSSLTKYVEQLSLDRNATAPELGFLSNIGELSTAVKNLHESWGLRKIELETAIAESKILFDTLPDVILMLNDRFEILRANNAAFLNLGQKIVGKNFNQVVKSEEILTQIKNVTNEEIDIEIFEENLHKDFRVRIEPFPVKGRIAIVVVMVDITESKKSKQLVKDFVGNASHEIRTPLTSLIGFLETVKEMDRDEHEEREHFISIMSEQAEHMNKLVKELLSLSKIEMNEHSLPTEKVSVEEIVKTGVKRINWLADKKSIKLHLEIEENIPEIIGDADELVQVVINLVSNAIKYSPEKTNVYVNLSTVSHYFNNESLVADNGKAVCFSVQDEGEGISKEDLPRITERFFRVDKVRSRKAGGTGLGLAIVKHILNRHRAELKIESELEKGSKFSVYIPVDLDNQA